MVLCGFPRENCIAHTRCKQVKASSYGGLAVSPTVMCSRTLVLAQAEYWAKNR